LNRKEKERFVAGLAESLKNAKILTLALYKGMSVKEMGDLRGKARAAGVFVKVTKNNLTKLALAGTSFAGLAEKFQGPTLIAHSADVVAGVKVFSEYAKTSDKLEILAASMEGRTLAPEEVKQLASLPSQDELRAKLIGLLTAPAGKLVRVLKEPAGKLVRVLGAYARAA